MSDKKCWIAIFTTASWEHFIAHGARETGFNRRRWKTVQKINPGDTVLCYLKSVSGFIGALTAAAEPYLDESAFFDGEYVPCRLPVTPVATLPVERALPVLDFRDSLSIFHNLADPNAWTGFFRNSPAQWDTYDGAVVTRAVREALETVESGGAASTGIKTFKSAIGPVTAPEDDRFSRSDEGAGPVRDPSIEIVHTLLETGARLGFEVWAAPYYRGTDSGGTGRGALPELMAATPESYDEAARVVLGLIDAAWYDGEKLAAAFQVIGEASTRPGVMRLADVLAILPDADTLLFAVAPARLKPAVITEVNRPLFAAMNTPLSAAVRFVPFNAVRARMFLRTFGREELEDLAEPLHP